MAGHDIRVRFWGVRGSLPSPSPTMQRGGGQTSCVEIRCGGDVLLFDAGTGLSLAGAQLMAEGVRDYDLFLTHCHYDHIMGLPFFKPLFSGGARVSVWSGHLHGAMTTRQIIEDFMRPPYFPVTPKVCDAAVAFNDFTPGDVLRPRQRIAIATAPLNHPGGAVGYRIEYRGCGIAYVTDTEHKPGTTDENVIRLIAGADLVIYDSAYTEAELSHLRGFGHSTWEEAVRLCRLAGAKRLALFHHSHTRDDAALDAIEAQARARFAGAFAARDGLQLAL